MKEVTTRPEVSPETMRARIGEVFGASEWWRIDQAMVDAFAKLTRDEYFIHVDPERAKRETPYGGTIVHGFFTMSLLAQMAYQVVPPVAGTTTGVNYGFDRLRFVSPVPTGSRVRAHFTLRNFETQPKRWTSTWDVTVEIEGSDKPALVAQWLNAGFF